MKAKDTRWSTHTSVASIALDLAPGVFTWTDPRRIALSLKDLADACTRRKRIPFRSATSMRVFHINRAGRNLDETQLRTREQVKNELRAPYAKRPTPKNRGQNTVFANMREARPLTEITGGILAKTVF